MNKSKYEAGNKDKPITIACYIRVGRVKQLSPETQSDYFNAQLEVDGKGEMLDASRGS